MRKNHYINRHRVVCGQNLVCSDGLYCRRHKSAVYGSCEDPAHT